VSDELGVVREEVGRDELFCFVNCICWIIYKFFVNYTVKREDWFRVLCCIFAGKLVISERSRVGGNILSL
jgi:hypothetical protein